MAIHSIEQLIEIANPLINFVWNSIPNRLLLFVLFLFIFILFYLLLFLFLL